MTPRTNLINLIFSVHENPILDDFQRLNYLKSCVKGVPASHIYSISITATNYALAWSILEEYYNQLKLIVEKHLKVICDLPKMQKASYDELAHFANIMQTNSSAIRLLGQAIYDILLIYILTARFNKDTRVRWFEDPRSNRFPTDFLIWFLISFIAFFAVHHFLYHETVDIFSKTVNIASVIYINLSSVVVPSGCVLRIIVVASFDHLFELSSSVKNSNTFGIP